MFVALAITITGCSKEDNNRRGALDPVKIKLNAKQLVVVESSNNFAFDIFARVNSGEEAGKNFMISPLSISYALSMTLNGAANETLTAMKSALSMAEMSVDDINSSFSTLTEALLSVDDKVDINIANSVWVMEGFDAPYFYPEVKTITMPRQRVHHQSGINRRDKRLDRGGDQRNDQGYVAGVEHRLEIAADQCDMFRGRMVLRF